MILLGYCSEAISDIQIASESQKPIFDFLNKKDFFNRCRSLTEFTAFLKLEAYFRKKSYMI